MNTAQSGWLFKDRHVKLVDGTTVTMADTPENQAEYLSACVHAQADPQQQSQTAGVGFPIAGMVMVISLAVGSVLEMAIAKDRSGN